jgi:hypothetical protein
MASVKGLCNTSADDCKISLRYVTDLGMLKEALATCIEQKQITKIKHIKCRIKQLERSLS